MCACCKVTELRQQWPSVPNRNCCLFETKMFHIDWPKDGVRCNRRSLFSIRIYIDILHGTGRALCDQCHCNAKWMSWLCKSSPAIARFISPTSDVQRQKAVSAYFTSEQILPFVFAAQNWVRILVQVTIYHRLRLRYILTCARIRPLVIGR